MVNNISNKPVILVFELLLVLLFISTLAFAIPNSLTIQGKLTNLAGSSQQGTFNFTFKIYDASTNGNELWAVINQSVTTDANGIYDVILGGINLSFAEQYYLGIAVQGENESSPRINLTSAPYSFRANTSEALNPNASYFVRNISISGHATIGNGTSLIEISTQLFNFSLTTGALNINGTVTAKSFVGDGSLLTGLSTGQIFNSSGANVYLNDTTARLGLGMTTPTEKLRVEGNVSITGNLFINETLNFTASSGNLRIAGNITLGDQIVFKLGEMIDNLVDGWLKVTGALNVTSSLIVTGGANITGDISVNNMFNITASSGNVNVGGILDAGNVRILGSNVQVEANAFKRINLTDFFGDSGFNGSVLRVGNMSNIRESLYNLANFTSNYDARSDRFGNSNFTTQYDNRADRYSITNYSSEYASTGYKLANFTSNLNSINASISLWNVSGSNIYPRFLSGNVGIGTTSPGQALHVVGSANISTTVNAPVINTTLATQNLTISSAAGSVIIRLG